METKIKQISSRLYLTFSVFLILMPVITAGFWIFYNQLPQSLISINSPAALQPPETLDALQRTLGFLVSLLPLAGKVFAIVTIIRLLKLYREGVIFSVKHVHHFKRLGQTLIFYGIAGIIESTGLDLIMTMNNPPGHRMLTFGVSSGDVTIFVIAAIVLMLSWVMEEGRKQAEEQSLTI